MKLPKIKMGQRRPNLPLQGTPGKLRLPVPSGLWPPVAPELTRWASALPKPDGPQRALNSHHTSASIPHRSLPRSFAMQLCHQPGAMLSASSRPTARTAPVRIMSVISLMPTTLSCSISACRPRKPMLPGTSVIRPGIWTRTAGRLVTY